MGTVTDTADDVYRDYVNDGVSNSGVYQPKKSDIRALFAEIDTELAAKVDLSSDQTIGGNKTFSSPIAIAPGVDPSDAVNVTQMNAAAAAGRVPPLPPVLAASTTNINLSSPGSTIDGVTLSNSGTDTFLAKDQTTASQNGVYVWNGASSAATRATSADSAAELGLATVYVKGGTTNGGKTYQCQQKSVDITVGSTSLTWLLVSDQSSLQAEIDSLLSLAQGTYLSRDVLVGAAIVTDNDNRVAAMTKIDGTIDFNPSEELYAKLVEALPSIAEPSDVARDVPLGVAIVKDNDERVAIAVGGDGKTTIFASETMLADLRNRLSGYLSAGELRGTLPFFGARAAGDYYAANFQDRAGRVFGVLQPIGGSQTTAIIDRPSAPLHYIPWSGQSNVCGGDANALFPDDLMPCTALGIFGASSNSSAYGDGYYDGSGYTDLIPLGPNDYNGMSGILSSASAMAYCLGYFNADYYVDEPGSVFFSSWQGGEPLSSFMPSTPGHYLYENLIAASGRISALARLYNRSSIQCDLFYFDQGESGPTGRSTYAAALDDYLDAVLPGLETALGQSSGTIKCAVIQTNKDGDASVNLAQWDETEARSDTILVGAVYHCPINSGDEIHETGIGRMLKGEMCAFAHNTYLRTGSWTPLKPSSAARSGAVITVTFEGPPGAKLSLDTDWVPSIANYGVSFTDDSSSASVSSVSITGDLELTVTLNTTPTGTNKKVQFGTVPTTTAGWNNRRTQLMFETARISPTWRIFDQLGLNYSVPKYTRCYCVVSDVAVS